MTWPQAKFLLSEMPPFTMRSVTTIGGAVFAFAVAVLRREALLPPRAQWGWLTVFAMLNFGGFMVFSTLALASVFSPPLVPRSDRPNAAA